MKHAVISSFDIISEGFRELITYICGNGDEIYLLVEANDDPEQCEWLKDLFPSPAVHVLDCPANIPSYLEKEKIDELLCIVHKAKDILPTVHRSEELIEGTSCQLHLCMVSHV